MRDRITVSLFERKDVYYMQYREPVTGNKVQKSTRIKIPDSGKLKIKKALSEAERIAGEWETKVNDGKDWRSGQMSWADFRYKFESEHLAGLADSSAKRHCNVLNNFENVIGPRRLKDIANTQTLSTYQRLRRESGTAEATIKADMTHIKAALNWAHQNRWLDAVPTIPKIQRAKTRKTMKGRPITGEEFDRMIMAVEKVIVEPNKGKASKRIDRNPDHDRIPSWKHLLNGLFWSGLRLGEAMQLHWNNRNKICVDLSGDFPRLVIPAAMQKSNQDEELAIAPEFAELLLQTPQNRRHGFVFNPAGQNNGKERLTDQTVTRTICAIGESAGIKVDTREKTNDDGERVKVIVFASAHDLRRAFGTRWASRIMPNELKTIMRHASIATTMKYYVGKDADKTSAILRAAMPKTDCLGDILGDTSSETVKS